MSKKYISIEKAEAKRANICSNCELVLYSCEECCEYFDDDDKVCCKETTTGWFHYCEHCNCHKEGEE